MKQLAFFLPFCTVCLLTACSKKNLPAPTEQAKVVIAAEQPAFIVSKSVIITPVTGSWRWIKAIDAEGGPRSPASTGYTQRYEFGSDSTAALYQNDKLISRLNYSYTKDFVYTDSRQTLKFDRVKVSSQSFKISISNDTLRMDTYDVADGGSNWYVRNK